MWSLSLLILCECVSSDVGHSKLDHEFHHDADADVVVEAVVLLAVVVVVVVVVVEVLSMAEVAAVPAV